MFGLAPPTLRLVVLLSALVVSRIVLETMGVSVLSLLVQVTPALVACHSGLGPFVRPFSLLLLDIPRELFI